NHMEGNTLTYGQTKLLLIFGDVQGDVKMRDLEEMKAHNVGLRWIRERAKEKEYVITERDIRDLNQIILVEDFYKLDPKTGNRYRVNVGKYKTRPNSVITATGEEFLYALPEETPAMMYELVKWFHDELNKGELSPIELAALFHYRYMRSHPIEDGNGRIARLLVTYVLERFDLPMIIIKSENKEEYLRALNQSDINVGLAPSDGANALLEDIAPFVEYMLRQLEWSLSIAIRAARGESVDEEGDWKKKLRTTYKSKIAAPEKSDEYVERFALKYLFPLLRRVDKELSEFYSIFDSVSWSYDFFKHNTLTISVESINWFSLNIVSRGERTEINFIWNLYQFRYEIQVRTDRTLFSITHRYDEEIKKEEVDLFIDTIGKNLLEVAEEIGKG
ncbi:MAG: Fic family protein, partial [Bacteroidales bacterium]